MAKKSGLSSVYKSSEEFYEFKCDPCESVGDLVEAEKFCFDCNEYLCSTCCRSHTRSKLSKHHSLSSKDKMPRKTKEFCNPCKVAGYEIKADGFCKDCQDYLCLDCYKSHPRNRFTRNHVIVKNEGAVSDQSLTTPLSTMSVKEEITGELNMNEEYTYDRDINIKSESDDKECYITGMTLVSDNKLVLCDYKNNCLKLVDINIDIIKDILPLQNGPCGITTISSDQIAVVQHEFYQIQIVNVSRKLTVDRTIKTSSKGLDVKMVNNQLYVSFCNPVKFQILQLTGAIIKTIKPDDKILKHCTRPRYIAVSPNETMIYVSDWKTEKVMSLDMNGNMLALYHGELENPHGIIISPSRSVYVCYREQELVYKIKSDLSEATVMLGPGDGLDCPHAICLNTAKQHLYISSGSSEAKYKNFLKVYKC